MRKWIKVFMVVAAIAVIAGVLVYKFVYNKKHPDYEKTAAAYTLTAKDLYDAFTADAGAADAKYTGRVIEISGILGKTETADSSVTVVFVFHQGDFGDEGVRCTMLEKYRQEAQRLQPDGEVRIKGYCTGFTGDVVLEKCSILYQNQ